MKEASLNRLYTVGFKLYDILEKITTVKTIIKSVFFRGSGEVGEKGMLNTQSTRDFILGQ